MIPTGISAAAEPPISPGSWTLAILPDTQIYAQSYPQHYDAQTQWIADHAESHNIKYVLHEGDITNRNTIGQWDNALASMNKLNGVVPYAMAPGNHDYGPNGNGGDRDSFFNSDSYFGPNSFYGSQASVGGFFEPSKTDNSWHTFNAGGKDWLVLALEWGPRNEVVDWANQVVSSHPNHDVMLVTHAYMYYDETIYDWSTKGSSQSWNPHGYGIHNTSTANDGQELWDKLVSQHDNFRMTFNGHVLNDGTGFRSTAGVGGNPVHQMLANYQMNAQGGMGDMRLLEFKDDGETVEVRTYSPVLDRLDMSYDQQFTLNLNELHSPLTPPPPPLISTAVAANILVTGPTDPAANTVDSVTVPHTSVPAIGTLQVNRGDYEIAIDGTGLVYHDGVLLATMRENVREGYRGTVEVGRDSFGTDILSLSVMETGNSSNNELNMNTSVAWFQFQAGWQGAHVNSDGTIAPGASNRVDQSMLAKQGMGRYTLDLGVNSESDGLLFTVANTNGNTLVHTGVLPYGEGWDIRVHDNATDFGATGEEKEFSFVYIPFQTEGLVGGRFDGASSANLSSTGNFSITRLATGQYELTIPDESPDSGMLLLSVAGLASKGGITAPDDNTLSYAAGDSGSFLIESTDLPSGNLQDTTFAWAFVKFSEPIAPVVLAGDYNRDGNIDFADYQQWKSQFDQSGSLTADGNGDGRVDLADYTVWRNNLGKSHQSLLNGSTQVLEPASIVFASLATGVALVSLRERGKKQQAADEAATAQLPSAPPTE
ncbi:metallophosphoesterase [Aeoliella sp. ICT_H6.2]|uniref:Metallophosphoesterase n=1 Tax=Aeoliella straminimaris TaxID=2954799 RepID=A0A9X2JIX9_9BACT|nr:metallophosphoesterase [Aeoliella straminimaris]MCO6046183.1 metallophosphoesterase [Aeoliella straminimaris]